MAVDRGDSIVAAAIVAYAGFSSTWQVPGHPLMSVCSPSPVMRSPEFCLKPDSVVCGSA